MQLINGQESFTKAILSISHLTSKLVTNPTKIVQKNHVVVHIKLGYDYIVIRILRYVSLINNLNNFIKKLFFKLFVLKVNIVKKIKMND